MVKNGYASPSSSPPTPPSPLPISVGPGHQKYSFSASPTPSPPFSPPSSHTSAENLPLMPVKASSPRPAPLAFSLDHQDAGDSDSPSSCLKELFTADFAVSVAGNWDDSESRSGGLPCQVVDSEHLVACYRMHLVSHAAAVAAAWASYHPDLLPPC
uniref:Uncharacterized protein n=1 Tax=Vitis vinifera TaxID=29760 RepID=A5AES7_VITVI|nr:hypothetical protein VITISV_042323 [Vitis vinifera]